MSKVNVFEVKAKFSEYLDRALRGERIVICRHNRPVAELRAIDDVRTEPRPIGPLPGRPTFEIPASFFAALPDEEIESWETVAAADPLASGSPVSKGRASRVAEKKAVRRVSRKPAPRRRS